MFFLVSSNNVLGVDNKFLSKRVKLDASANFLFFVVKNFPLIACLS